MATEYWIHCVSYGTDPERIESAGAFKTTTESTSSLVPWIGDFLKKSVTGRSPENLDRPLPKSLH